MTRRAGLDRRLRRSLIPALLAAVLLVPACKAFRQVAARYPRADIEQIYGRSAHNPDRNPVILIPGFAGSTLVRREDSGMVWGEFFTKTALGYSKREGMRAFALDVDGLTDHYDYRRLASIDDDTSAVALLERVRTDALVTDVNFPVYATLVELLQRAGYVLRSPDDTVQSNAVAPGYFSFVYDWRQDNVSNAVALGRFIEAARIQVEADRRRSLLADRPVKFDVIAHSMGGLIARYYLRYGAQDVLAEPDPQVTWAGAQDVDRLILISTPNFGSMKVLRDLVYGRDFPVLARIQPALLATLVSLYQMLPRQHHALWIDEQGRPVELDFMSADTWRRNEWGPFAPNQDKYLEWLFPTIASPADRELRLAAFMDAAFERARRLARALDRHSGSRCPATLVLFTGDADPTLSRALVSRHEGRIVLKFDRPDKRGLTAPGDGTITRASALADERPPGSRQGWLISPIRWDWTIFISDRHSTFLGNPTFQNNILHLLVEAPPPNAAEQSTGKPE